MPARSSLLWALVLAAAPAGAADLWVDPPKTKSAVALPSVAPLVVRLEPAVLVVFTETEAEVGHAGLGVLPPGHPPIDPELPFPPGEEPPEIRGQGAGFLIHPSGYALTNHHVVENALSIRVLVGDDREEISAHIVGSDEKTDVALIQLDSPRKDWPVIPLGDSDALAVGDIVVAIGSPFGLQQSVSAGILSARGRRDIAPSGRNGLYDFLQTDASINPGNSGGPLLSLAGEAIGMNSAVNAAGAGIGFAIPINLVKKILPQLKAKGRFDRSWIGVSIQAVLPEHAKGFGLDRPRGALVREVVEGGPGAQAGLLPGDIITKFDGRPVIDSYDLPFLAGDAGVGRTVPLEIVRDRKTKTVRIVLGNHPDNHTAPKLAKKREPKNAAGNLGLSVVSLGADDRQRLKLHADLKGARITKIRPGSPAFLAGLEVDDVIVDVNKRSIPSAAAFADVVKNTPSGQLLKVSLRRGASLLFVPLLKP